MRSHESSPASRKGTDGSTVPPPVRLAVVAHTSSRRNEASEDSRGDGNDDSTACRQSNVKIISLWHTLELWWGASS